MTIASQFLEMSHNVKKRTFGHLRPTKIPIRLRIRAVWSEFSQGAFLIAKSAKVLNADNGWAGWAEIAGRTCQKASFLTFVRKSHSHGT